MGIQCLSEITALLNEAGIPAGEAYPDREWAGITEAVAAVSLGSVEQQTGLAEVMVRVLSPRKLGAWQCQETAVQVMEILNASGLCCRMEDVAYEDGCDCFRVTVLARDAGLVDGGWQMEKLTYKGWSWPQNPEQFLIDAVREPEYSTAEDGTKTYEGLSPLCRTISGKGVFSGAGAAASYKALAAFLETDTAGALVHPVWGTINACLLELKMEAESRENWVVYSFVFREADTEGSIPVLSRPSNWVIYTY